MDPRFLTDFDLFLRAEIDLFCCRPERSDKFSDDSNSFYGVFDLFEFGATAG